MSDPIIDRLRADGHDVWSVSESLPSIADKDVLQIATNQQRLLLTEDKDFGDLIMRDKKPAPYGVVLYRLPVVTASGRAQSDIVAEAFATYGPQFASMFSVIDEYRVRIRPLP